MIVASRKDLNEAIKWSKKNSPVAYLVLSMNGKWGVPGENPENIVSSFKRLWPDTRAFLKRVAVMNFKDGGRIRPTELDIAYPQPKIKTQIHLDFFTLLDEMPQYMNRVEDYESLENLCREMLQLIVWKKVNQDVLEGTICYALDKQERYEEAYQFYSDLPNKSEATASVYSLSLLDRIDIDRAEKVLGPYRVSLDKDVQARIQLLDRLKAVKSSHAHGIS